MSSGPKIFKNKCDYRTISGEFCGKKCIETRCSSHKGCESYTIRCIYHDANNIQCGRYTRSKSKKCSHHVKTPAPQQVSQAKPNEEVKTEEEVKPEVVAEKKVEPVKRSMQLAREAKQRKANERLQEITKQVKEVKIEQSESEEEDEE
jgi:flagellar biosynthesis GTPase FlhF